jgi:hypothetical protein
VPVPQQDAENSPIGSAPRVDDGMLGATLPARWPTPG